MTVAQIATHLFGYFSPEERSVPDSVTYPGRNAAVLAAINAALQETTSQGRPWVVTDVRGGILNAPTAVTIALTAGSASASITTWAAWMAGCTIAIEGEPIDNQIRSNSNPVTLKFPATTTGTVNATVYANSFPLASDIMDVRKPIRVDGFDLYDMASEKPTRRPIVHNDYGSSVMRMPSPAYDSRAADTAGQPRFYRVTTWTPSSTAGPLQRIEVYPAPSALSRIEYKASLVPAVITNLASTDTLQIPFNFIQSVFLPIAERVLMDSPYFRSNAAANTIIESDRKARALLEQLKPNKTTSPRIVPLG